MSFDGQNIIQKNLHSILTLEDGMQIFLDDILSIEAHTSTTL